MEEKIVADKSNSTQNVIETFSEKGTYLTSSKKFEYTKRNIVFSLVYSLVISLIPACVGSVLLISHDASISVAGVLNRFIAILTISTITFFILRITLKRFIEIFSIGFFFIFILTYVFLLVLVPRQSRICSKLGGSFQRTSYYNTKTPGINYTCFIDRETKENIKENSSFVSSFMIFETKK